MLARVRAKTGRVATLAGAGLLTGGLLTDALCAPGLVAAATAAGIGLAANPRILRSSAVRAVAVSVYAAPHAGCAAILLAERLAPDTAVSHLVQAGAVALWGCATWYLRPGQLAADLVAESVAQEIAEATKAGQDDQAEETEETAEPAPALPEDPAARWWADLAVDGGVAPGTVLLDHQRVSEECVAFIVGSAERGVPVPEIPRRRLSAFLDIPEEHIEVGPVPGRGTGVCLLVIGRRPAPEQPEQHEADSDAVTWAEIAATAMPGVELIEANTYDMRKELT
ncbi:hypothetical protein ACPCK9_26780 [Streptomyces koyangensis]|uniref:hypothetical protein n=1 Tax=Streptomyces koyangensis TaxID=188770 RepID=UPI003C2D1985